LRVNPVPYPADTRAKGWRFELDYERIRQSDTWALAAPEHRPWLLMLWMVAWEQTPCGSLPDDDTLIAARIGMAPAPFAKARGTLRRGWWLAEDGRLYHHAITQHVLRMIEKRAKEAARKAGNRHTTPAPVPRDNTGTDGTSTSNTSTSKEKRERASRRCPPKFLVDAELQRWAREKVPLVDIRAETEAFRDCEFPKAHADWPATWRSWMRREQKKLASVRPALAEVARATVPYRPPGPDSALEKMKRDVMTPEQEAAAEAARLAFAAKHKPLKVAAA
jgi:hypothetical protein